MANITPRLLALGTVGVAATVAAVSGVFATFSPNLIQGQNCSGYGFHAGYGYGYDCVQANQYNGSAGGGSSYSSASTSTTTVNPATTPVVTPAVTPNAVTTVIFKDFTKNCEVTIKDLTDSRLTAYYNDLQVMNQSNTGRTLTRAEFLKLVLNAAKVDVSKEAAPTYSDVPADHSLANYIAYATRIGMVSGSNGMFRPNDTISRAEAAKIFVNAAGIGISMDVHTFSDVAKTNSLATFIQTAYDNCILHGRKTMGGESTLGNGTRVYEPTSGITLAETAKVLYNIAHR